MTHTTITARTTAFVLVPGHWLGSWAWDEVASRLRDRGHLVRALTLPGLDPNDPHRADRTLGDQADAVRAEIEALRRSGASVVLVAHSGAGFVSSVVLDRNPRLVERIVYVDSGPVSDGAAFDPALASDATEVVLPPFDELPASLDGLTDAQLDRFRTRSVPMPGAVVRDRVVLRNDDRRDVQSTIISCSFPAEAVLRLAQEGDPMLAEVAHLRNLTIRDLPTGHWPMWSRPDDLAAMIVEAARAE